MFYLTWGACFSFVLILLAVARRQMLKTINKIVKILVCCLCSCTIDEDDLIFVETNITDFATSLLMIQMWGELNKVTETNFVSFATILI